MMLPFAAALALSLAGGEDEVLPRSLGQAEAPQPRPDLRAPQDGATHDVFSFGRVQASARVGFTGFSEDFESDPQFLAGVAARVDWPWMSRDVFGFESDRIGLYLDFGVSKIDRDLEFLRKKSATVFFVGFGTDINLYEDETCIFRAQLGVQYGNFGGVTDTDDGFAGVAGLDLGVKIAQDMAIVLNPQVAFGNAGDQVYFLNLGLQIRF
jgi:hypothetical protein